MLFINAMTGSSPRIKGALLSLQKKYTVFMKLKTSFRSTLYGIFKICLQFMRIFKDFIGFERFFGIFNDSKHLHRMSKISKDFYKISREF